MKISVLFTAPAASGILVWLAMPDLALTAMIWVALIPLLVAVAGCESNRRCWLAGYIYGLVYAALCVKWITVVPEFPVTGYLAMVAWIALFPALFALFLGIVLRGTGWPLWLAAPPLWAAIEYLRVILPVAPSPLALLGHVFYENPPMLQFASIASAYGTGFIVVLVNAALADALPGISAFLRGVKPVQPAGRMGLAACLAVAVPLTTIAWGRAQLPERDPGTEAVMTVAAVQANIPQAMKWQRSQRMTILDQHREFTQQAVLDGTDLVVWPETAIPGDLKRILFIREYIAELAAELSVPILAGSAAGDKDGSGAERNFKVTNSAFLIDTRGEIVDEYHKLKLLPFAEQVPFGEDFPWPDWMTPADRSFTPGEGIHLLRLATSSIGVVICWENLFPQLFRRFADAGAGFMVNMTNEAWFDNSEAGYYLLASAVFRAVENGVALLRVANTGVSALIDPHGNILQRITDQQGNDLMVSGVLNVEVPVPLDSTFYRRYGDVFALACLAMTILMLTYSLVHRQVLQRQAVRADNL